MTRNELVTAAREWVEADAAHLPGFAGALLHGSILEAQPGESRAASPASDVDVLVVIDHPNPPAKSGKLVYRDVLLDVTYLSGAAIDVPEAVLANYHLAPSFARPVILADPTDRLATIGREVARRFADPRWVWRRVLHARENFAGKIDSAKRRAPMHDRVMAWVFATGVLCHILLVAGLRNPTVRRRFVAARRLLQTVGRLDLYPRLLDLLGSSRLSAGVAACHLSRMEAAFDAAKAALRSEFPFSGDISDVARPLNVDDSRRMIHDGDCREAAFWIVVTYCRSLKILEVDAPAQFDAHIEGFATLLRDLGIETASDLDGRIAGVESALPEVMAAARALMPAPSP